MIMAADTQPGTSAFVALQGERYISLTTFRRDGTPVATIVWFVEHSHGLAVYTGTQSGKVKRLRHTANVTLAPCTIRGAITGPTLMGNARLVDDATQIAAIRAALAKKYGFQSWALTMLDRMRHLFTAEKETAWAYIVISPLGG